MKISILILALCLWLIGWPVAAQQNPIPADRFEELGPAHCGDNIALLDVITQRTAADKLIIIIARLGDGETRANLNRRRLHNVRTYWTEYLTAEGARRKPQTAILAEGERVAGYGRLEFYVDGKLIGVLKIGRNADLLVGTCYPTPEERDPCTLKSDRNFYPCRDLSPKRRKNRQLKFS
jgi:hypothetical protein